MICNDEFTTNFTKTNQSQSDCFHSKGTILQFRQETPHLELIQWALNINCVVEWMNLHSTVVFHWFQWWLSHNIFDTNEKIVLALGSSSNDRKSFMLARILPYSYQYIRIACSESCRQNVNTVGTEGNPLVATWIKCLVGSKYSSHGYMQMDGALSYWGFQCYGKQIIQSTQAIYCGRSSVG